MNIFDTDENTIPNRPFVTEGELESTRNRVLQLIESGKTFNDSLFGDIFEYLYHHSDNVSTRYSCQGHWGKRHLEMPYVMFVANEKGIHELDTFFSLFVRVLVREKVPSFYIAQLSRNYRTDNPDDRWIPVFNWSFKLPILKKESGEHIREQVIGAFCEAVKRTWPVEK